MPVVPFIPLIAAGVSAGTQLYTSHKAADTAKEAAATQAKSGEDALAFLKENQAKTEQTLQPWISSGGWAATTLGGLMGQPTQTAALTTPTTPTTYNTPALRPTTPGGDRIRRVKDANDTQFDTDMADWRESRRADRVAARLGDTMSLHAEPASITAQNQSSYTRMRAPDGTEKDVPTLQVPHFTSLGATVVA